VLRTISKGQFFFKEDKDLFGYFKVGSSFVGVKGKANSDVPALTINPAKYTYDKIEDFRGPFWASVGPKDAFIVLLDHPEATINGPLEKAIDKEIEVRGTFTQD
jgi:hypothetical protein